MNFHLYIIQIGFGVFNYNPIQTHTHTHTLAEKRVFRLYVELNYVHCKLTSKRFNTAFIHAFEKSAGGKIYVSLVMNWAALKFIGTN